MRIDLFKSRTPRSKRRAHLPGGKIVGRLLYFQAQRQHPGKNNRALKLAPAKPVASLFRAGRNKPANAAPQDSLLLAAHEHLATMAAPLQVQARWKPLGPFLQPHGQTYGTGPHSRPSISGRVSGIAVDPANPAHLLICAAGGGVWESKDTGATWAPRTDDQPSLAMGAIAFNPANPAVVYAGTGEGDSTFVDSPNLLGVGLLRSEDGGATWKVHATAPFKNAGFYDLVIDPLDGNHLLAATTIGLFESSDGGGQWKQRRAQRTWSLSMHPVIAGNADSTKEVFAGCTDGAFRSANGGATWSKVALPGAPSTFDRVEVCSAPSDGNIVYVFAAGPPQQPVPGNSTSTQPKGYLWRRSVSGGAFAKAALPPDLETGQAWYDWFAAVAPNNPDVLFVGGINSHRGVRSSTGQWAWTNISAKTNGDSIHPDQHAIAFSPADPGVVYIGCDGGIYRSPDSGASWQSLNQGLCTSEIEFLAQHPQFETWLLAGTQDNGTMRYQGQEVWYHVGDGDGGDCATDFDMPYTCYHTFFGMGIARSTEGGAWNAWLVNKDPNAPDAMIGPPVDKSENYPDGALFYPPVEANGALLAQAGNKLFISRDNGTHWVKLSLPLTKGELCSALTSPVATQIYVGTSNGKIFSVVFSGGTWSAKALQSPATGFISDLQVDPGNKNRIYATFTNVAGSASHIFRSDKGGADWLDISAGLPNLAINAMEIDPLHTDTIFVAADLGVYKSTTAGGAWSAYNQGLPNALIKDLLFHAPSRLLRAGAQARGAWEIAVDAATQPDVEIYLRDSAIDSGRLSPSPSGVNDPFTFNAQAFWWQCQDIKVDSPPFLTASMSNLDFGVFADDHSLIDQELEFSAGLYSENPQRNLTARIYVQVHNRGAKPATNVAVKVFFAAAGLSFPDLPNRFWSNFPNNTVAGDSPWQPVAAHKTIASIAPGRSEIVGFEWAVPSTAADATALLSILTSDDDPLATTELHVPDLVRNDKKCGLRNLLVVNSAPASGPALTAVPLSLSHLPTSQNVSLNADTAASAIVYGVVLSKTLAKAARKAGLRRVKLSADYHDQVARLFSRSPELKKSLDLSTAFALGKSLDKLSFSASSGEQLVLLARPDASPGRGTIFQTNKDGQILGGITLQVRPS